MNPISYLICLFPNLADSPHRSFGIVLCWLKSSQKAPCETSSKTVHLYDWISFQKHSRLHVEDVFDALGRGRPGWLGRLPVTLFGPGHLDLLPGTLSALGRGQRGGRGRWVGVADELDLGRGGHRGRGRL